MTNKLAWQFVVALIRWIICLPLEIGINIVAFPAALVLPFFANGDGWLPKWLSWFQTPDDSLFGDDGWKNEHWQFRYKLPLIFSIYVGMVGWLIRNRAYGFSGSITGFQQMASQNCKQWGDPATSNSPYKNGYFFTIQGYAFELYVIFPSPFKGDCCRIRIGWKLGSNPTDPDNFKGPTEYVFYPFNPFSTANTGS